ncbi:unnamed protein product [Cochlearia groenlandica]
MANHGGSSSSEDLHTVFVDTNLDTHLLLAVRNDDRISDFKVKFCEEHQNCFSEVGKIRVSAVKVKHREQFYSLIDSMRMGLAFLGVETDWDLHVDVVVVKEDEIIGIMDVDQNCSDPDLLDEKKEPGSDSILVTWHTEDLSLEEEDAKTVVKKTKKRKMESSDGKRGRKKRAVDVNRSSVEVDASQSCEVSSREKPDDIIMGAIYIEREKKNDISMEENQQTSEADKPCQEKFISVNSEHVDGHSRGEVKDLEGNQTLESCGKIPIEELDGLKGVNIDVEKGEETTELVKMDQEKNIMTTLVTARDDVNGSHEKLDGLVSGVIEKDNEIGEGSRLAPSAAANLQSVDLITYSENQLETSSNLTTGQATEKKKKKKKSSKDHIDQSADPVITAASDIVNTDPILRKETLENLPVEAIQKEKEMGEKSVKDLETNSGMTISPVTEKKKKRKKSSKDHINQSSSVATTTSKETMNEINRVPENVDHVDALPESFPISKRGKLGNPIAEERQQENETGEKMDVDMGSEKAIPTAADIVQTDTFVSDPVNKLEGNSVLTAGPAIEKKRKHKKSTKEKTTQSTADTTISKVNEREKVSGSIDRVALTSDSGAEKRADTLVNAIETENEMTDNQQVAVFESTPVCEVGKLNDENISREHEVAKDINSEIDAGEAKSVKSLKKKSSRKSKTPAKDDTLVASGAQNVEPIIKAVDGEEPKNLIKKNETEENLNKTAKKSSKKSKKNDSLNNVDAQVLSVEVNNTAQKEVPLISNTKDTDASLFTPAKKDTTSFLKKHNDKAEDNSPSKQIVKENVDIGDNFGSSQKETITGGVEKQDQVTGETKSIKAKKSRDLHPGGSIDGSLSSMKPKERKGKVQPSSLQSSVKYDRNVSKLDRSVASKKVAVNNKNEALKKSSNSAAVKKGAMSFFKDSEWDSTDDESKKTLPASGVSTKAPSDSSSGDDSDDDSDVTSISRKQENNVSGGTNGLSGSLQDILRSSKSFKMAKLRASQSLPDVYDDDLPAVDCVPDSQAN